ncbi:MAG: hypothetical protein HQ500_03000 [Flavobacteriales bacterium]|nr:hypothetical protein [Flavobacteriales bacterium]
MLKGFIGAALVLFYSGVFAQSKQMVEASIMWQDGHASEEKIYIELDPPGSYSVSFGVMQDEIAYEGENGGRQYIRPQEVKRIAFDYGEKSHVMISTFYNGNYHMLQCEVEDKLRVLQYYPSLTNGEETFFETDDVNFRVLSVEGGNQGSNTKIFQLGFRRSMMDLFTGYPDMIQKVKDRDYTYDNWEEMVKHFNEKHGKAAQ